MLNAARRVASGAAWMYGAQLATIALQFGYAAITSRTVNPAGFGAYAVALSATALVGLISNGGLAQTSARLTVVSREIVRSLLSYALLLGLAGSLFLFLTADLWANLWGSPFSAAPIRWLCISTFLAPALGLASGLVRRLGKFRNFAILTLVANVLGMSLGAIAVLHWRGASSLLVSPISTQILMIFGAFFLNGRILMGLAKLKSAKSEVKFSAQIILTTIASYLTGNVGAWSASFGIGPAALGQWNRADVVAFVPFQQIKSAIVQAVYPEFRHDREDGGRARDVWPDLLGIVAWTTFPIAAGAAVILPHLIPILFGPGWEVAAILSVPITLAGGLTTISGVLASGIEAVGRFRWIWSGQVALAVSSIVGAVGALSLHSLVPLMISTVAGTILQHAVQIVLANKYGYLRAKLLFTHYLGAAAASALIALATWIGIKMMELNDFGFVTITILALVIIGIAGLLWFLRSKLPPVKLAHKYGLLKRT
jgi:O-antigen/teichoic acid export membrane protein